jgi:hypothetical protein
MQDVGTFLSRFEIDRTLKATPRAKVWLEVDGN